MHAYHTDDVYFGADCFVWWDCCIYDVAYDWSIDVSCCVVAELGHRILKVTMDMLPGLAWSVANCGLKPAAPIQMVWKPAVPSPSHRCRWRESPPHRARRTMQMAWKPAAPSPPHRYCAEWIIVGGNRFCYNVGMCMKPSKRRARKERENNFPEIAQKHGDQLPQRVVLCYFPGGAQQIHLWR